MAASGAAGLEAVAEAAQAAEAGEQQPDGEEAKMATPPTAPKHKLQSYASKLERSFVKQLREAPDAARAQVAEWLEVTKDCITILQTWADVEGKYGASLDKIIVSANVLNDVDAGCESGLVAAVAAVVGGFQSLGKHHLGMQQCILTQADTVLTPLIKDHRKQVQEWTLGQTSVQRETKTLLGAVERARETGSALAVQQALVKYEKQARAQRASLREYLSHLYTLWLHRGETILICVDAMAEANQHVLNFSEEVATTLENIVAGVDPAAELRKDIRSIVDTNISGTGGSDGQPASSKDAEDVAALVYEALGRVEPDVASASVEAAASACGNWATIARVAESVSRELAAAVNQRARDTDALASSMQLEHLRVSCEYADVFSEEETKETERQAWRMFMVIMKQSSMVLADFATRLTSTADGFAAVRAAYESGSKQVLAARTAAHKELQLVANSLKDARSRVDQCDEAIARARQSRERALSDAADIRVKMGSGTPGAIDAAQAETAPSSNASESGSPDGLVSEDAEAAVSAAPQGTSSSPGVGSVASVAAAAAAAETTRTEPAGSTVTETDSQPDFDPASASSGAAGAQGQTSAAGTGGATTNNNNNNSGAASGGSKSVVKRLFRLSAPSRAENLADAEERAEKLAKRLTSLQEQRANLQTEVNESSQRLEAQIKAYAVQIAGTVSGFVSIHQTRLRDLKVGLEKLVRGASNFTATIRQLDQKLMQELKKMEPVTDIERFSAAPHTQPADATVLGPFRSAKKAEAAGEEQSTGGEVEAPSAHDDNADDDDDDDGEDDDEGEDGAMDAVPTLNRRAAGFAKKKIKLTESEMLTEEFGLPANETVVASYSCAYLPGKVPQQGRLILTKQFMCFSTLAIYEPVFGSCKLVVHLAHVNKVIKAATAWGLVANTLVVRLQPRAEGQAQPELTFTSLFHRDKCHGRIVQLSGVNRDLVEKGTKTHSQKAPWHELDPRLGDSYKGNKLVIGPGDGAAAADNAAASPAADSLRKARNSGFLRLGLSTSEVQQMVEANEQRANKLRDAAAGTGASDAEGSSLVPTGSAAEGEGPFAKPCVQCLRPPGSEPCQCWKVDAPKLLPDHTELSTSFWMGSLESVAARLWLGRDRPDLSLPAQYDLACDLGESLGDYDQDFPPFEAKQDGDAVAHAFARENYPTAALMCENDESSTEDGLVRVVSFAHPVGNSPWGKQVARSAQVQRILGLKPTDGDATTFTATNDQGRLVLNCDTSLSGFPFSDSFMVRTRYVLSEMTNERKTHPDEAWCRLDVSCRIKWLKAVAVPFLKGKIEKENIATGKRNMAAWVDLARRKMPAPASATKVTSDATKTPEAEAAARSTLVVAQEIVDELLSEVTRPSFYADAWREASAPQRLQLLLTALLVLFQLIGFVSSVLRAS